MTGAAFVGWDSTYSFNADGRRIPMERVGALRLPAGRSRPASSSSRPPAAAPSTMPRYDVRFRVNDLFVGDEERGPGHRRSLALRGDELSGEVDVASPRLALTGTGRIALDATGRLRADVPLPRQLARSRTSGCSCPKLSPYTTAVASGSIRVAGELADVDHLLVDGTVDTLDMTAVRLRDSQRRARSGSRSTSTSSGSTDLRAGRRRHAV